jgi:hypothetical protein
VNAQFGNMQGMLAKLGIESTAKPNYMTGEQLEQAKGQNGETGGPYQGPKNMAAVLSGMVQPTGLMNFQDTGIQDVLKSAQGKAKSDKTDLSEKLKTYLASEKKLNNMKSTCQKGDIKHDSAEGRDDRVSSTNDSLCRQILKCGSSVLGNAASALRQALAATASADEANKTKVASMFDALSTDEKCQEQAAVCQAMIYGQGKDSAYTANQRGSNDDGTKGNN